jgi:AcrR family transcriptional regulator
VARTRDEDARRRILAATRHLLHERGPLQVGIDDIAREADVGKQTIYRWWRSKTAVVLDALGEITEPELRFPDTGSTEEDLRREMRQVTRVLSSDVGPLVREIVAAAQGDAQVAEDLRTRVFAHRRRLAADTLRRGMARGEVRDDLDLEAAIDALYAPLWLRLIMGHQPLSPKAADAVVDVVWPGLSSLPSAPAATARSPRRRRPAAAGA